MRQKDFRPKGNRDKNLDLYRTNELITADTIRIVNIGDWDERIPELGNQYLGNVIQDLVTRKLALDTAEKLGTDLVEISYNEKDETSICKLIDYSKFLYQQKKKEKENRKRNTAAESKEVRLTPVIDEGDLKTKTKQIRKFLEDGSRVKLTMFFKGRMIEHSDMGKIKLLQIVDGLMDVARVEQLPTLMGKRMFLSLVPKR